MKFSRIVAFILVLGVGVVSAAAPAFAASPTVGISDFDVTLSIQQSYLVNITRTTFTKYYALDDYGVAYKITAYIPETQFVNFLSDYIPCSGNKSIFIFNTNASDFNWLMSIAFYDQNQTFISGLGYGGIDYYKFQAIPETAYYVRFSTAGGSGVYASTAAQRYGAVMSDTPASQLNDSNYQNLLFTDIQLYNFNTDTIYTNYNTSYTSYIYLKGILLSNISVESLGFTFNTKLYVNDTYSQLQPSGGEGGCVFFDTSGNEVSVTTASSLPFSPYGQFLTGKKFSYFLISLPVAILQQGSLFFEFTDFRLNDLDVQANIQVQNTIDQLRDLAGQIAVPTPDKNALLNPVASALAYADDPNFNTAFSFFKENTGILSTYLIIVLSFAVLGYIFFGKRSSGGGGG